MTYPVTLTEGVALIAQRSPQDQAAAEVTGPDLMFGRDGTLDTPINQAFVVVHLGVLGTDVTLSLEQATTDGFSDTKIITGSDGVDKSIELDGANEQAIINLKAEELDSANGFKYWRFRVASTGTNSTYGVLVFGGDSRYGPTSDYDLSTLTVLK
tara:strand:+ start:53 stop:517 length:465 start_codon:yes stop_codon:yes gene_type:complete